MARPMVTAGFAYVVGLIFAACLIPSLGIAVSAAVLGFIFAAALIFSLKKREFSPVTLAAVCLALSFIQYGTFYQLKIAPDLKFDGREGEITAVVTDVENYGNRNNYFCRLESIDGEAAEGDIDFLYRSFEALPLDENDRISAIVKFTADDTVYGPENLSNFMDVNVVLRAELTEGNTEILEKRPSKTPVDEKLRNFFSLRLRKYMPLSGSDLAEAMLYGDRSNISHEVTDNFKLSGIAHLLAISGIHLTVLMGLVQTLCGLAGLGRRSQSIITALFLLLYMVITGFPYSLLRAGIMALTLCLAQLSGRERDELSALSFAVLLICVVSPAAIWDYGFLLSVSSMLGIVVIHRRLNELCELYIFESALPGFLRYILKVVIPPLSVGISAAAAAFPLVAVIYKYYNILSIVTTSVLSIPCSIILGGGLAISILGDLGITRVIGAAVSWAAEFMKTAAAIMADLGGAFMPFTAWIFVLYLVIVVAVFALSKKKAGARKIAAAVVCCLLVFTTSAIKDNHRANELSGLFASVSDNGTGLLVVKEGKCYAITTGKVIPYTAKRFIAEMDLELVGSNLEDNEKGQEYNLFPEGDESFREKSIGVIVRAFDRDIAINPDKRVSGEYDILLQLTDGTEPAIPADVRELNIMCVEGDSSPDDITKNMPAGSNIVLQQGCGVFIEFDDEIHISKFDYGY